MTFLSPLSAIIAAAITVPLLLLLYVLRLRRQRLRVASTLLWAKSFEDLQANTPFQRLRWSLLLLLQMLLLLALLLAIAEPMIRGEGVAAARTVLLIDCSASMNARLPGLESNPADRRDDQPPPTRLDAAKAQAREMIDALSRSNEPRQMMIIAFGQSPRVITTYESNRSLLLAAVDRIPPTHEHANLDAALKLAGAFAAGRDEGEQEQPDVVLISDGGVDVRDSSTAFRLRSGRFRFAQVLSEPVAGATMVFNNVGITSFSARRDLEDPARVLAFARLSNCSSTPVQLIVTLTIDDQVAATLRRTIPAASETDAGEDSFTHALDLPGGALLGLRHNHRDDLSADDSAWLVLPEPLQPRIALVHAAGSSPDPFVHDLLDAMEPQRIDAMSLDRYNALDVQQLDSGAFYELIVFDRVASPRLPGVPSMTFGAVPLAIASDDEQQNEAARAGKYILSWDRQHPLMRNVSMDTIVFAEFDRLHLPQSATPLAFGPEGPVIAVLSARGARHVVVGFEMIKSNWPLHVSSAVFMQNAMDYLTLARSGQSGIVFRPGEPVTIRTTAAATSIKIDGPARSELNVSPGSMVTLPSLGEVGVYEIDGAMPPYQRVAVSMLSDMESDIRPNTVLVNPEQSQVGSVAAPALQPLWPWLVWAGLLLLILEWLVYCRRARGT